MPSAVIESSAVASAAGSAYPLPSRVVVVDPLEPPEPLDPPDPPDPLDPPTMVIVAPASGRPVSSESTWPVTTPSAITRRVCEADEELPARSVAVTASVSVSPTDAAAGTVNASVAGAVVNDPAGRPLTVAAICASPT